MFTVHEITDRERGENTFDYCYTHPVSLPDDEKKPSEDVIICNQRITNHATIKLYALVNGFRNGTIVSRFIARELITRILHNDKLIETDPNSDIDGYDLMVKEIIHNAFINTDKDYLNQHIDGNLATIYALKSAAEDMTAENVEKLYEANNKISGGAVVVLILIVNKRLYVANCGNSRAILVKQGIDVTDLNVFQISELHENHEVKEIQRLEQLNLPPMVIEGASRCFGDFFRKGGYKDNEKLKGAISEPIIVEPTMFGGIEIDEKYCFVLLLSPSLCQAILKVETEKKLSEYVTQVLINKINDVKKIDGAVDATLNNISDDLRLKVEQQHCQAPEYGLSMMYIPLNDNVVDLVNPVDGNDRSIKTQSTSSGCVDSYVDFPEYFSDTPEAEDLRCSIIGKVESLKQYYREMKPKLHAISED